MILKRLFSDLMKQATSRDDSTVCTEKRDLDLVLH